MIKTIKLNKNITLNNLRQINFLLGENFTSRSLVLNSLYSRILNDNTINMITINHNELNNTTLDLTGLTISPKQLPKYIVFSDLAVFEPDLTELLDETKVYLWNIFDLPEDFSLKNIKHSPITLPAFTINALQYLKHWLNNNEYAVFIWKHPELYLDSYRIIKYTKAVLDVLSEYKNIQTFIETNSIETLITILEIIEWNDIAAYHIHWNKEAVIRHDAKKLDLLIRLDSNPLVSSLYRTKGNRLLNKYNIPPESNNVT